MQLLNTLWGCTFQCKYSVDQRINWEIMEKSSFVIYLGFNSKSITIGADILIKLTIESSSTPLTWGGYMGNSIAELRWS